jgi:phthiodiolone/phenolphthiodiolone dimycocerosates ketoreductase
LKLGTIIDDVSPEDSLRRGILAEKLGFDSLWFSDHLIDTGGLKVDPYTTMGAIAARTSRIKMCAAVSDVQRIHPAKLAHMVSTLSSLSGGRAWLGVGAGEAMNLVPFGIEFDRAPERVERLAEAIQVVKALWSSSRSHAVSFPGQYYQLHDAWLDLEPNATPKVIVGALGGKKALEVAGKYGDGWVSWLNTPETFAKKLRIARSAARSSVRGEASFEACVWVYTALTSDEAKIRKALNRAKRGLLAEANTLKMMGFERPEGLGSHTFQNMLVSEDTARMIEASQDTVPDSIVRNIVAAGSPSHLVARLKDFENAGATHALIHFVTDDGDSAMEEFSSKVLGAFQ